MAYGHNITALAPSGDVFTGYLTSSKETLVTELNILYTKQPASVRVSDAQRYPLDLEDGMLEFEAICSRSSDRQREELGNLFLGIDDMLFMYEDSMAHLEEKHRIEDPELWRLTTVSDRLDGHYHACQGNVHYTFNTGSLSAEKKRPLLPVVDATVYMDGVEVFSTPFIAINPRVYLFSYTMERASNPVEE